MNKKKPVKKNPSLKLHVELEDVVDKHGLGVVLSALSLVCNEKSEHVLWAWQDKPLATAWARAGLWLDTLSGKVSKLKG
jgi:hypothetical protein